MVSIFKKRKAMKYFKYKSKESSNGMVNLLMSKNDLNLTRKEMLKIVKYYEKKGKLKHIPQIANNNTPEEYTQDFISLLPKKRKYVKIPDWLKSIIIPVIVGIIIYILQYLLKPILDCLTKFLYG